MLMRNFIRFAFSVMLTCCFGLPAWSADLFEDGRVSYLKQDYQVALGKFEGVISQYPSNAQAHYYAALCQQQLRQFEAAKKEFLLITQKFPGTESARLAAVALEQFNAAQRASATTRGNNSIGASDSGSSSQDTLPAQGTLSYELTDTKMMIPIEINGIRSQGEFDTGAGSCMLRRDVLDASGLNLVSGSPYGHYRRTGQAIWKVRISLSAGGITRRNFDVDVIDYGPWPTHSLIGNEFFEHYIRRVDTSAGRIYLVKEGSGAATVATGTDVPFVMKKGTTCVTASANGHNFLCCLDTGGNDALAMTLQQAMQIGIAVPENAESVTIGRSPALPASLFYLDSVRIAGLELKQVKTYVFKSDVLWGSDEPTLGTAVSALTSYQYTIDNQRSVIIFQRK